VSRCLSLAAAALVWAALGASCGSSPETLPPATTPRTLVAMPESIWIGPGKRGDLRFLLRGPAGAPLANATVTFAIVDNPDTPGQEAQGATLLNVSATTDAQPRPR
jgi:diadenosine tetraphosphatase ApaH/serine/threonine PP2A family protein phosphatase